MKKKSLTFYKLKIQTWNVLISAFLISIFISLFFSIQLSAQIQSIEIETGKYYPEQIGFVNDIFQDSRGFLWIATNKGLYKYDGYNYTEFTHDSENQSSISSIKVNCIVEDEYGKLWIGTKNKLNCFDPATEKFTRFDVKKSINNVRRNAILKIIYDNNNVWIISDYLSLTKLNTVTGEINNYTYQNNTKEFHDFNDIAVDSSGKLWIIGSGGLKSFDIKKETFKTYRNDSIYPNSSNYNGGYSLHLDGDILWIGSVNYGIGQFNITHEKFSEFDHILPESGKETNINSMSKGADGSLWLSTRNKGVFKIFFKKQGIFKSAHKITHYRVPIQNSWVNKVYTDRSGIAWIGSKGDGLMSILPEYKKIEYYKKIKGEPNSLSFKSVRAIYEDNDHVLWVSGYSGFNKIDPKTGKYTLIDSTCYYNICQDKNDPDILWLTNETRTDLFQFNKKTFLISSLPTYLGSEESSNFLFSIIDNGDGTLWLGTNLRLQKFNKTTHKSISYKHDPDDTNSILKGKVIAFVKDSYGKIWCRTASGLSCFDTKTETFENYLNSPDDPNSVGSNYVISIYEDKNKTFWVGTAGGGLNRFNRADKSFTRYTKKTDFPGNIIISILEDEQNNLWVGSEVGIIKFNPITHCTKVYDTSDGLLNMNFNSSAQFKNKQGKLFFGTEDGIISFFPEEMKDNPYKPNIVLTSLRIFNKDTIVGKHISMLDTLKLSYKDKMISFEVAALNFIKPEKNQYKYKLVGFNDDWINLGTKRKIVFTNLDIGSYILQIAASNNDGIWSDELNLHIIISPPHWKTWWFYTLLAIFGFSILLVLYKLRTRELEKDKTQLELTVKERTEELSSSLETVNQQKEEIEAQAAKLKKSLKIQDVLNQQFYAKNLEVEFQNIDIKEKAEELAIINEKLVELDQFKESMTGMIVHDLKNPLNGILNISKCHSLEKQIQHMKQSGKQMLNMVLNILDVYKYEENKMLVEKSDYSLLEISINAIDEVAFLVEQKNITIDNTIAPETGVKADNEIIKRIFVNLLTNAIKYTSNNGKIIIGCELQITNEKTISHQHLTKEKQFAIVKITDAGQGIPKDKLHKVFERFEQVKAKKSGRIKSTGLGLTFCKLAMEAHGGKIGVESKEGVSTTFWFTLPVTGISEKIMKLHNKQKSDQETTQSIMSLLTTNDKKILEPFVLQIKNYEFYDVSILRDLLKQTEALENERMKIWREEMRDALGNGNEEKYKELLKL